MASKQKEEVRENTCVVCFKEVEIFSIGQCDHPVCFECSTRMRVLCRQNECPMCRQDMPTVIFTRKIKPFESMKDGNFPFDNKYKISFFTAAEKAAYDDLLAHVCPECGKVSPNFGHLRDHVRRVHLLTYCDLCVDNLKILTKERRCYTRKDLATHRRVGDADDRSHRGHPLCEFCDKRYMDTDELYRHLRREHLFCHFCDADGHHCYYKTYDSLRDHYRTDHFLCEEGDCYMEKFTSVFRTDIDLKAHKAVTHGKGLSKAGMKQARTLDIAFTLAPRPRPQRNNRYQNQGPSGAAPREEDPEGAVGGAAEEPPPQIENPPQPVSTGLNTNCIEEFPSLGGGAAPPPPPAASGGKQHKVRTASSSVRPRNQFSMDDFPALGPEAPPAPAVSTSVTMRVNTERPASSNAPPQTNLSIQVSSPRFTTTVTSKKTYNMHFPALDEGAGAPPVASTTASVQWTAKKKQSKESQTPQLSVASQVSKPKPLPQMDDFPALEPKASNKPLFPIRPPKTSTASNTTGTEELFATSKSKKKKSKPKGSSSAGSVVDASSFLKKKPEDSGGLRREDFLKKKPAESGAGEPSVTNYRSAAQEKRERLYDGMIETEKSTIRQADPNMKMVTAEQVMMMKGGSGKENKREQANKPVKMDESAFPALPGFGPPPGFEAKWETKKSSKPKAPAPGLTKTAPPPGLTKTAPPPGLEGPGLPPPNVQSSGPPGFEPVNGSFPPLQTESTYALPPHFERRNTTLVDKIAKALGTDALNDFKQISFAFRNTMLAPAEYYNYCKEMMGNDSFISIFPELLALLPDIRKQQEIWPHYKTDKERFEASTTKGNRLEACATCGQVLRSGDLRDHLTRHSLDNHFPTLDGPKVGKNAWAHK